MLRIRSGILLLLRTCEHGSLPRWNGVRVESALYSGCDISPYYDSMAAKIIVYGDTRVEAVRRMRRALEETIIEGIDTTLLLQYLILFKSSIS